MSITDVYAESFEKQDELITAFAELGLDENLRMCKIHEWRQVLDLCVGYGVIDAYGWSDVTSDTVKTWALSARNVIDNYQDFGIHAIADVWRCCLYLETCATYDAHLWVC